MKKPCAQRKTSLSEIRQNPCTSRITKKVVNQFATQVNWLVSIRDKLLSKDISKQTEFRFAVSEQALADNRSINKWQVTCSMYNLFDRCKLGQPLVVVVSYLVHYNTLLPNDVITKCDSYLITKCDKRLHMQISGYQNLNFALNSLTELHSL